MHRSNNNIFYRCAYHALWWFKYRRGLLNITFVEQRLKKIVLQVPAETGCQISEMEADGAHVHLLVERDPQFEAQPAN